MPPKLEEKEGIIDLKRKRDEKAMLERIRKSLSEEKEPDPKNILRAVEEDDPDYLKAVKK